MKDIDVCDSPNQKNGGTCGKSAVQWVWSKDMDRLYVSCDDCQLILTIHLQDLTRLEAEACSVMQS